MNDFLISKAQFEYFLERHAHIEALVPETNDDLIGSYVMVDPAGRFFDNQTGEHRYSKPILDVGVAQALSEVSYDQAKFLRRGGAYDWIVDKGTYNHHQHTTHQIPRGDGC